MHLQVSTVPKTYSTCRAMIWNDFGFYLKDNNWNYIFFSIISSVLIFYFNRFSAALGKTDKLPIEISVWMPIVIIFIISSVGLIHANQK